MSNNLNVPQLTESQANKELRVNEMVGALDAAITEILTVDVTAGDVLLTSPQFRSAGNFYISGAAVARTVTFPALKRGQFVVKAASGNVADVKVKVGTTEVTLAPGAMAIAYTDGTTNGLRVAQFAASNLSALGDVNLAAGPPTAGRTLAYDAASSKWVQGYAIRIMANQAAYDALGTYDANTLYFIKA